MAHKLSFPVINLIVVLLGLSIGASQTRNTLWAGFGATIGAAFGYYLLMDFGLELGRSGMLPPLVSAWSGNVPRAASRSTYSAPYSCSGVQTTEIAVWPRSPGLAPCAGLG